MPATGARPSSDRLRRSSPSISMNWSIAADRSRVTSGASVATGDGAIPALGSAVVADPGPWLRSVQDPPISVPVPFWYSVVDARLLGSTRLEGHSVWTVSFFDPTTPAWFEAEIDKQSGRTLELWMTAASHFMHHLYGPFNAAIELKPPAGPP